MHASRNQRVIQSNKVVVSANSLKFKLVKEQKRSYLDLPKS